MDEQQLLAVLQVRWDTVTFCAKLWDGNPDVRLTAADVEDALRGLFVTDVSGEDVFVQLQYGNWLKIEPRYGDVSVEVPFPANEQLTDQILEVTDVLYDRGFIPEQYRVEPNRVSHEMKGGFTAPVRMNLDDFAMHQECIVCPAGWVVWSMHAPQDDTRLSTFIFKEGDPMEIMTLLDVREDEEATMRAFGLAVAPFCELA